MQNQIKCNNCVSNYVLNSNNVCVNCGVGCSFCKFQDEKIICISCYEDYLWDGNICQKMYVPQYCTNHKKERFSNKNEFVCTSCDYKFALDIKNNKCIHCLNYCTSCHLDDSNRLIYDNCDLNYVLNETKLCEFCTSNEEIGGEGCLQCKYENGINKCTDSRNDCIHIDNDYVCKLPSEVNLHIGCKNATSLKNGKYTCKICRDISYTMITKYNNIKDCYPSENELVNCEYETQDEDKNLTCTNCLYRYRFIWSKKYQTNICDNQCASDYFFNNNYNIRGCFKCDDESGGGQIGCNPKNGCSYIAADNHIYCNSCKTGYFRYDWQCLTCSKKDINCIECDFNNTENKFKCNKCINNTFYVNNETGLCDKMIYNEYPNIIPGCILPVNNYEIYMKENKCFDCKYGFFKTREESCIYCKARKNGGPKCDECQYIKDENGIETNKINCKICQNGNMLSPIGKRCYNCEDEVGPECEKCIFENETERVICEKCKENYYLNGKGYCTYMDCNDKFTSNCLIYDNNYSNSERIPSNFPQCKICNDGYFVNNRGRCEILYLEVCSLNSMFNFEKPIYDECKKFCQMMNYSFVDYKNNNEKIENILKNNLNILYDSLDEEIKDIIENGKLCLNNLEENNELKKCIKIEYDSITKNYKCSKCINGYQLINSTNKCVLISKIEKPSKECNNEAILLKQRKVLFVKNQ